MNPAIWARTSSTTDFVYIGPSAHQSKRKEDSQAGPCASGFDSLVTCFVFGESPVNSFFAEVMNWKGRKFTYTDIMKI